MRSKAIGGMFYGRGGIGPAGVSLVVQRPNWFRKLPRPIQNWWGLRAMRPAAALWLKSRTENVPIHTGRSLVQAQVEGERLRVGWNDASARAWDQVILGTGYRVNIALYPFFSREVLERIDLVDGYPRLDAGFETSLPGLHFLGAPAAWSFGPLMKFVAGTEFAAQALRRRILEAKRPQQVSRRNREGVPLPTLGLESRPHRSK
jgi:hypothetical protein